MYVGKVVRGRNFLHGLVDQRSLHGDGANSLFHQNYGNTTFGCGLVFIKIYVVEWIERLLLKW